MDPQKLLEFTFFLCLTVAPLAPSNWHCVQRIFFAADPPALAEEGVMLMGMAKDAEALQRRRGK
jgi:hypothetical protein